MRKVSLFCVGMAVAALVLPAANVAVAATALKLAGHNVESPLPNVVGMKAFKSYVESRSGGGITVRNFFGTLGSGERELLQQVQQGTLDMAVVSDAPLASFYPDIQVLSIPYLFESSPVAWRFMESKFMADMAEDIRRKTGLRVLAFFENGFRNLTNNARPIRTPDDLKGLKIRTMESQVYIRLINSLGATATPIAFPELIMSLQQNVVDGQENAVPDMYENGIIDVQKYLSLDEHVYGVTLLVINDELFTSLPDNEKQVLLDGAGVLKYVCNSAKAGAIDEYLKKIESKGVAIHYTTPEEKAQFRSLSQEPVKNYIVGLVGQDLVDRMLEAVAEAHKEVYAF